MFEPGSARFISLGFATRSGASRPDRLPSLMDQRTISSELGVTPAAAEKIMRQVPKVHFNGLRKVYVKRTDVQELLDEATRS